jgi:(R,R)-butanediol dehydrogenase / meso-butanediol dehydrogenase / diacetyl reductase
MRAALLREGGAFDLASMTDPVPQAGELLVRVTACGLCGSDLKARGFLPVGTIMGHEFGGQVVEVGPGVEGWRHGMQVAVLPVASCGTCVWCRSGEVAHCSSAVLIGLDGSAGGFADLTVVPAASSFEVPAPVDPLHVALVEPYAVGLHCAHAGQIAQGDDVLVIGAGTVGLTTVAWASQSGAQRITCVDPMAGRRGRAEAFGATDTHANPGEAAQDGYDVVFECVGKLGLLDAAVAAARPKGRIVVAGVCTEQDPFWSMLALLKEVSIRFAVYYTPAEFGAVIDAFASGDIDPGRLVGRTVELAGLDDAFAALAAGSTSGKILVKPS